VTDRDGVDLASVRAELLDALAEAVAQRDARAADFEEYVAGADLVNTDDEHDPEGATIAFERAQVIALRDDAIRRIELIEQALSRIEDGTYGRCTGCGRPIPAARLAAVPGVQTCVSCAARGVEP
jgi:RNA polymerase-binding transcription factor DksA